MPAPPARFAGAVLAGGRSRRMGTDKALVLVRDGRPLALVAAEALRAAGGEPVVAVGGDPALAAHGLAVLPDRHPDEGPLGGLVTALSGLGAPVVVVLTCDLPAVTATEVEALVCALAEAPSAEAAVATVAGRPQFLSAAYRASALGVLQAAFARGERSVRRAMPALRIVEVPGLEPAHLADVDTPAELAPHLADT
ncbi:MAG: NTP transferase domain-containing protein [Acidimicrobiia bacterium]|nr:NTP transferase domain-containing protein [Acidimicrobiia bacterium]